MSNDTLDPEQLTISADALYREEVFTDRKVGTIQRLTPVNGDGEVDTARETLYVGQTQLMTPMGALPINFDIAATTLGEAADQFAPNAQKAVQETMEKVNEARREAASSIVTPGQGGPGGGMGGAPGGNIQMP